MTTPPLLTTAEVRGLRLIAQRLAPSTSVPTLPPPASGGPLHAVAGHMLATQAQNLTAGVAALALRAGLPETTEADLAESGVVRSWSQRGTHHFLAAEEVRWVTLLCAPRVQAASAKRRGQLGLTDDDVDTCREALYSAVRQAGTPVSRSEAYRIFAAAGVDPDGGRGPHMLRHFGGEGVLVQGLRSTDGARAEDTFVLHDEVVPRPRDLSGDDALRELAVRYYRSRGPATVKDLAWWSGLTVRDCRRATGLALETSSVTETSTEDGRTVYLADWQRDVTAAELVDALRTPRDLPAFDEYLMGYTDRSDIMTPGVAAEVGPTKNGLVHACHVEDGTVTGRS
ncbi:winged helix DNA-binding domain-containing protein [Corynebacterium sp. USCH3]|uniref:winged helix DNA-binding domain-containing protein n=1 Tax=Corynebacterium sp. USCH3 TaxID=3024840 RepID=UPI00309E30D8